MIMDQVLAVRDQMLIMVSKYSSNPIALYLAEVAFEEFVRVNSGNEIYAVEIDVRHVAWIEISRCLDIVAYSRHVWVGNVSLDQIYEWGNDLLEVLKAYDELSEIRSKLIAEGVSF